ncbi:MAG: hypothetical protein JXO22_13595 [Phycisphaerae bacterium]|nr:hypothetical protein [Phycisphaerae bacterium]
MATVQQTDSTECVLAGMLAENTGTHFLDSGGTPKFDDDGQYVGSEHGYGRQWERNRGRNFEGEPATVVNFRYGIEVTHHVYHWLKDRIEYDAELQERFEQFCEEVDPEHDRYWLDLMESFPEWLRDQGHEVTGLYGDGDPFTQNTYNGEDLLSQVLQFLYLEMDGDAYVLLQIHGGCDVRGGYTAPKAFRVMDDGATLLCNADGQIYCDPAATDAPGQLALNGEPVPPPQSHSWMTDDAYHWYADGACGYGAGTQLEQYDRKEIETPDDWEPGFLCVDADGNGYC